MLCSTKTHGIVWDQVNYYAVTVAMNLDYLLISRKIQIPIIPSHLTILCQIKMNLLGTYHLQTIVMDTEIFT